MVFQGVPPRATPESATKTVPTGDALASMTRQQLVALATKRGLSVRSRATKAELVKLLEA